MLESSVDSLQVESSTNEQSGHSETHAIFNENITSMDNFIKQEDVDVSLPIATVANVSSSSNQKIVSNSELCRVEMVPSTLFETVNNDVIVDSTTAVNISTSATVNSSLPSFTFNNFTSTALSHQPLSGVVTYGLPSNFSNTILHLDNSQHLLPSAIPFEQYFNQQNSIDKRDEHVILDQHQLLPSTLQTFSNDGQCLLSDASLTDNFLNDIHYNDDSETINSQENVICDLPVLTRAKASLPIDYLFLSEIDADLGVFAKKPISIRSQFGPIEGVITTLTENHFSPSTLAYNSKSSLLIFISESVILSQTDENNSNWTRFVRPAQNASEQNVELITREFTNDFKFYFYTTRNIMPNEELKVWYSKDYANKFNIRTFETTNDINLNISESEFDANNKIILSNSSLNNMSSGGHKLRNKIAKSQLSQLQQIPSQECVKISSQHDIQSNLGGNDIQDLLNSSINMASNEPPIIVLNKIIDEENVLVIGDDNGSSNLENLKPVNTNATATKITKPDKFQCDKCQRVFPRHYSLRRHQVMHAGNFFFNLV